MTTDHRDHGRPEHQKATDQPRPPYMGKFALEPLPGLFGEPLPDAPPGPQPLPERHAGADTTEA